MGGVVDFNYIFFGRHERKYRIVKLVLIYLIAFVVIYYGYKHANIIQESAEEKIKNQQTEQLKDVDLQRLENHAKNGSLTEFNEGYCRNNLPTKAETKEYIVNYTLEGNYGKQSRWLSNTAPSNAFSIMSLPSYFLVYKGNSFEGCGYKTIITDKEKVLFLVEELNRTNNLCKNKSLIITENDFSLYIKVDIFSQINENVVQYSIFVSPAFRLEKFLDSAGCNK